MKYFVSYAHSNGFGNCILERGTPWKSETAKSAARDIEEGAGVKDVVVLYFCELKEATS
jgi:hypothetical protein